jgi:hypothetical protein
MLTDSQQVYKNMLSLHARRRHLIVGRTRRDRAWAPDFHASREILPQRFRLVVGYYTVIRRKLRATTDDG